uniref:Uncharacterized protein n=1 Tax=Panagrolaimus sp. PS1159 TaxID=55785 RepID=A0AC35GF90_9BILA
MFVAFADGQIKQFFYPSDSTVFSTYGDKETEILWEFISDGSIQFHGFDIDFETINCACANPEIIVPCTMNRIEVFLMKDSYEHDGFYCEVGTGTQLPAENHNILQVITTFSSEPRFLEFSFFAINISITLPPVIINFTKPYYFYQPCIYNSFRRK